MTHSKITNVKYLFLIDLSFRYHSLWLDEFSSYLTTFSCQFGRYRCTWLLFGSTQAGDMLHRKIDEILKGLSDVLNIADGITVVGSDSNKADNDSIPSRVLQTCIKENIK